MTEVKALSKNVFTNQEQKLMIEERLNTALKLKISVRNFLKFVGWLMGDL